MWAIDIRWKLITLNEYFLKITPCRAAASQRCWANHRRLSREASDSQQGARARAVRVNPVAGAVAFGSRLRRAQVCRILLRGFDDAVRFL